MNNDPIISTTELAKNLGNPRFSIVDCRFDLLNPSWGYENYLQDHIPGAIYMDLNVDLSGHVSEKTGRHPLPDPETFIQLLEKNGVSPSHTIVMYDTSSGQFAVRLWWLLKTYGYAHIKMLDGGYQKWKLEQHLSDMGLFQPTEISLRQPIVPDPNMFLTTTEVEKIYLNPDFLLVDARSPERYRGDIEPIDTIAGHIPGSINRFHGDNLQSDGTLKPKTQLITEFSDLLKGIPPSRVIFYCGSGVTSCFHVLALDYLNMFGSRLYPGSWSEWIRDKNHPVEVTLQNQ